MSEKTDSRFARLHTDPRFRRPKQKQLKVEIDDRFKDVLESEEFGGKGKGKGKASNLVDKRGRPLNSTHHADQLKRFYRLRSPEAEEEGEEGGFVDYARGEGNLSSSGSESEESDEEDDNASGSGSGSSDAEELEIGGKRKVRFDPLAGIDSDSDAESEGHLSINLSEEEDNVVEEEDEEGDHDEEADNYAEPTKRIAAVNLDWDNLRAADLFSVFNSFLTGKSGGESSTMGRLLNVKIYPSEFGKARMEKEEAEGPGADIFKSKVSAANGKSSSKKQYKISRSKKSMEEEEDTDDEVSDDEEDDEEVSEEEEELSEEDDLSEDEEDNVKGSRREPTEIDGLEIVSDVPSDDGEEGDVNMDQLRKYQLDRLRYYYAIATFSTVSAAKKVVSECNGTEFERTANMLDLTYVPDEMEFDEADLQDEATKEMKGYKGNDFVTDALRHSKVKLTWDQDDPNRTKVTRRNLTKEEMEEEDFNAYLASSGSEEESDDNGKQDGKKQANGESSAREKKGRKDALRDLLLAGDDEVGDVWGKAGRSNYQDYGGDAPDNGGMEITFKPALSANMQSKNDENLTTLERYQMRVKEKKARKKEKIELKRAGKTADDDKSGESDGGDDFFGDDGASSADEEEASGKQNGDEEDDAELDSDDEIHQDLKSGTGGRGVEHFSMKDIMKAEKGEGKKSKRKRGSKKKRDAQEQREVELGKEGWKIDTKDERFKAIHQEPDFAIDPSNPRFTKTKAMKELLAERQKQKSQPGSARTNEDINKKKPVQQGSRDDNAQGLDSLVESVKRKMGNKPRPRKRSKK